LGDWFYGYWELVYLDLGDGSLFGIGILGEWDLVSLGSVGGCLLRPWDCCFMVWGLVVVVVFVLLCFVWVFVGFVGVVCLGGLVWVLGCVCFGVFLWFWVVVLWVLFGFLGLGLVCVCVWLWGFLLFFCCFVCVLVVGCVFCFVVVFV
jgi:hypothetical protein